jgi:hypothetical protein
MQVTFTAIVACLDGRSSLMRKMRPRLRFPFQGRRTRVVGHLEKSWHHSKTVGLGAALVAALTTLLGGADPARGKDPSGTPRGEWPMIQSGVWELQSSRTLPNGKVQRWTDTSRECRDPTELFRGYWGLGIVERAGCRYEAKKDSPTKFTITSECMIRGAGRVNSEMVASIGDQSTFELQVNVTEGRRRYRGEQKGRRTGPCVEDPSKESR